MGTQLREFSLKQTRKKKKKEGNSPAVQWLRLGALTAEDLGSFLLRVPRCHKPHGEIRKKKKKKQPKQALCWEKKRSHIERSGDVSLLKWQLTWMFCQLKQPRKGTLVYRPLNTKSKGQAAVGRRSLSCWVQGLRIHSPVPRTRFNPWGAGKISPAVVGQRSSGATTTQPGGSSTREVKHHTWRAAPHFTATWESPRNNGEPV